LRGGELENASAEDYLAIGGESAREMRRGQTAPICHFDGPQNNVNYRVSRTFCLHANKIKLHTLGGRNFPPLREKNSKDSAGHDLFLIWK